jgi:hypothetical protein
MRTNAEIHHEFTLLQLAADRADDEVMATIHGDQTRHRDANINTAQKVRVIHEQRVDEFYKENHEAIRLHIAAQPNSRKEQPMMRLTTIAKKIETLFQNHRDKQGSMFRVLADVHVHVQIEGGHNRLWITYDGSGNEELNHDNFDPAGIRADLNRLVGAHGFYAEDITNWSMGIYHA